jgi:hypothetical protein
VRCSTEPRHELTHYREELLELCETAVVTERDLGRCDVTLSLHDSSSHNSGAEDAASAERCVRNSFRAKVPLTHS